MWVPWPLDHPLGSFGARVTLFPDGLLLDDAFLPFALVDDVAGDGGRVTLARRGLAPLSVEGLGSEAAALVAAVDRARRDLAGLTASAYAALDPGLGGLSAPDGWAVPAAAAGRHWAVLRRVVAGPEVDVLAGIAGDGLRLGVKVLAVGRPVPFALAPVGAKVVLEVTGPTRGATLVFGAADADRLNAALLVLNLRREALELPDARLGRWALAARAVDVVGWARAALVARVPHGDRWEDNVTAALAA
jgi:hypothetical protein